MILYNLLGGKTPCPSWRPALKCWAGDHWWGCASLKLGNSGFFKRNLSQDLKQEQTSGAGQVGEGSSTAMGQGSYVFNQNIAKHWMQFLNVLSHNYKCSINFALATLLSENLAVPGKSLACGIIGVPWCCPGWTELKVSLSCFPGDPLCCWLVCWH